MMLQDVVSRQAPFQAILVLDVSRWGRFQDIDESAHYEFLCKQAGAPVHYCSETFSNDTTLASMIIKTLKRSMAAEYSRELSAKVAAGHRRLASLGFRNGGIAGYGGSILLGLGFIQFGVERFQKIMRGLRAFVAVRALEIFYQR